MLKIIDVIKVLKDTEYRYTANEDKFAYYDTKEEKFFIYTLYDVEEIEGSSSNIQKLDDLLENNPELKLLYEMKNDETKRYVYLKNPFGQTKLTYTFIELYISNRNIYPQLSRSFSGHNKYGRFKKCLQELSLMDKYYDFLNDTLISVAEKWCLKNNIEYTK